MGQWSIGKGGLEMGEDLRCRQARGGRWPGRQLGRRAAAAECRADLALCRGRTVSRCAARSDRSDGSRRRGWRRGCCRRRRVGGSATERAVVRLSRRILSAHQTLKVRPQPGRALRLLQKIRRARRVFRWGLLSSKPYKQPCRISVPTTLQCGQGVSLSRSAMASHSSASRQNQRSLPTGNAVPKKNHSTGMAEVAG